MISPQEQEFRAKLKELRDHLTKNADNVGESFPNVRWENPWLDAIRTSNPPLYLAYVSVPVAAVGVWALVAFGSYRYAERVYRFLINARTGEVQGERPYSGRLPVIEEIAIRLPPRRSTMAGMNARKVRNTPSGSVAIDADQPRRRRCRAIT